MEKSITDLAENKVLILYILNLIDTDIRQDDLFKIITSINNMNYFIFKQNLKNWQIYYNNISIWLKSLQFRIKNDIIICKIDDKDKTKE